MTPNGSNDTVTLEIIRASEVTPREVKWLWYPYIPFGKITLLQGDPGDGKSKFMLALSAFGGIKKGLRILLIVQKNRNGEFGPKWKVP